VALPARLVMVALAAVAKILNVVRPPERFTIAAFAAVASATKSVSPPTLVIWIWPADVPLKNVVRPELRIEVIADVLALTISNTPALVTAPTMLAVCVASPSCSAPQLQMVVPPE
jgi:hypothetical protein